MIRRRKGLTTARATGLTEKEHEALYAELFERQDGGCAICGTSPKVGGRRLHVDHCHKTGVIRGLLCWRCNTGLERFRDNPDTLIQAAAYTRRTL